MNTKAAGCRLHATSPVAAQHRYLLPLGVHTPLRCCPMLTWHGRFHGQPHIGGAIGRQLGEGEGGAPHLGAPSHGAVPNPDLQHLQWHNTKGGEDELAKRRLT